MEHEEAIRLQMTEQYLLDELSPEAREEFEEHYFECRECAVDVGAGAAFVEQSKIVLEEKPVPVPVDSPVKPGWLGWLRPALAAPLLAGLLLLVGYQNLVTYPELLQTANHPQGLPWAAVNIGTFSSGGAVVTAHPGQGFLLMVRIPQDGSYSRYIADLSNPAGKVEWSLAIPAIEASATGMQATETQDEWAVVVPGANRPSGTYALAVRGVNAAGENKELGRGVFELKIQN